MAEELPGYIPEDLRKFFLDETENLKNKCAHYSFDLLEMVRRVLTAPSTKEFWESWPGSGEAALLAFRDARCGSSVPPERRFTTQQLRKNYAQLAEKLRRLNYFVKKSFPDPEALLWELGELEALAGRQAEEAEANIIFQPGREDFKRVSFVRRLDRGLRVRVQEAEPSYEPSPKAVAALTNACLGLVGDAELCRNDVERMLRPKRDRVSGKK